MNDKLLRSFKFWDTLDKALEKKQWSSERRSSLYPSEASVVAINPITKKAEVLGGCLRKSWYRLLKFTPTEPFTTKTQYTFAFGNMIEDFVKDLAIKAGVYNNSSVKFFDRKSGVSGEIDLVLEIPIDEKGNMGYIHTEVKSTWGGQMSNGFEVGVAKSLFDHPEGRHPNKVMVKAKPRDSNVLQLILYLYQHMDDEDLVGGKLVYLLRDNFNRTEFDVTLKKEGKKHRAVINGEVETGYFVEDIYARYREVGLKVNEDIKLVKSGVPKEDLIPPERDFALVYTDEEAKDAFDSGNLGKVKYNNHINGKSKSGDWHCSYCSFKTLCWEKQASGTKSKVA